MSLLWHCGRNQLDRQQIRSRARMCRRMHRPISMAALDHSNRRCRNLAPRAAESLRLNGSAQAIASPPSAHSPSVSRADSQSSTSLSIATGEESYGHKTRSIWRPGSQHRAEPDEPHSRANRASLRATRSALMMPTLCKRSLMRPIPKCPSVALALSRTLPPGTI